MAKLSNHQILDLAYEVGWRKAGDLERALAVVLAESGGKTDVTSYTGCCHGLFQINTNSTTKTKAELYDAKTNAQEAFRLWSSRGWQPWVSSRGGQLLRGPEARLSASTWQASPGVGSQGVGGAIGEAGKAATGAVTGAVPGVGETVQAINKFRDWITTPANLGRLALGIVAGAVILIGIATLVAKPATEVVKAVKPL